MKKDQERITELEQENAKLRAEVAAAKRSKGGLIQTHNLDLPKPDDRPRRSIVLTTNSPGYGAAAKLSTHALRDLPTMEERQEQILAKVRRKRPGKGSEDV